MIRKARTEDIPAVAAIYEAIIDQEEQGLAAIGWQRGVYPTAETAMEALKAGELFVLEADGCVVASARINQQQMPEYARVDWQYPAPADQVMVLHTLTVDPQAGRRGYGRQFLAFYEDYARAHRCTCLRIDTNAKNAVARGMYARHGYRESGIVPCTFNGIDSVHLVCLEKAL